MEIENILNVWMDHFAEPAGNLVSTNKGNIYFTYSQEYLASENFIPLSLAMPRTDEPFGDDQARAFFDNLLQENELLETVMAREGIARADVVGLLYHLGVDCSGAVSCLPVDEPPIKAPGNLNADYKALSNAEINEIVRRLADREPLPESTRDPSPIAGVQSKIAIAILENGCFALPKPGLKVPTTHILKVPRRGKGHEAHLELAAAQLADQCRLPVAIPEVVSFDGIDALLIKRYDRIIDDEGNVTRLHQEDFAQALGLPAILKYERKGGPGRKFDIQAINTVLEATSTPLISRKLFLEATFFNIAIGNTDNHAKNHALLYNGSITPSVAPLYDLLPIRLDDSVTHELSFKIGQARFFDEMTIKDCFDFFQELEMSAKGADNFIKTTLVELIENIEIGSRALPKPKFKKFDDLIGNELERLRDILDLDVDIKERDLFVFKAGAFNLPS